MWENVYPGLDHKLHMLASYLTDHPDAVVLPDFAHGADSLHSDWYQCDKEYPDEPDSPADSPVEDLQR